MATVSLRLSANATETLPTPPDACLAFDSALDQAARLSARLGASKAEAQAAEAQLRQTQAERWPQLSAYGRTATSGGSGLLDGRTDNQIGLEARQRLFDFGKTRFQSEAARARLSAADHLLNHSRDAVYYEAALRFIDILEARERLGAAQKRLTNYQSMMTSLPRQLETSLLTLAEANSIAAQTAIAESNMIEDRLALEAAEAQLFVLTGSEASACQHLPPRLTKVAGTLLKADSALDTHIDAHATVQAYKAERQAAQADLQRVKRERLPTFSASGVVAYVYDDVHNSWEQEERLGLNVSTPLWGAGRHRAEQDAARARRTIAEQNLDRTRRELLADMTVTLRRVLSGEALLRARKLASLNLAEESAAITREFENGQRTYHDVEAAEAEYQVALLQQISAKYSLHTQQLHLLFLRQKIQPVVLHATANIPDPNQASKQAIKSDP